MTTITRIFLILALLGLSAGSLLAEEWGTLKGQILWEGEIPERKKIDLEGIRDEFCAKDQLYSEALLVDPDTRGLKNVVVYIYLSRKAETPPIHPDYQTTLEEKVLIDNKGCLFQPHVSMLRTGQTLEITNSDPVPHNTAAYLIRNNPFNILTPVGKTETRQLKKRESRPVRVECSIHPWMRGWLLVLDHPYMACTDEQGRFELPNLPAGKWTFQFWHESFGYLKEVKLNGEPTQWKKGRTELEITPDGLDLSQITVSADHIVK